MSSSDSPSRTARELIGRFESMSSRPILHHAPRSLSLPKADYELPPATPPLSTLRSRSQTPLRASFRNLISLFAKKGKVKEEPILSTRYEPPVLVDLPRDDQASLSTLMTPSMGHSSLYDILKRGSVFRLCSYLDPPSSALPVWNGCDMKLFSTHLLVQSPSPHGNPIVEEISLSDCQDVHSVARSRITDLEKDLLPTDTELFLFELIFDNRKPERFAVKTVLERSSWVSAMWDALLLRQDSEGLEVGSSKPTTVPRIEMPSLTITVEHEQYNEIKLPTVDKDRLDNRESKSHSSSIQKLDNISVVRSRLAQSNERSCSGVPCECLSTRSCSNPTHSTPDSRALLSTAGHGFTRLTASAPTSPVSVRRVGAREHLLNMYGEKPLPPVTDPLDPELIIDLYGLKSPIPGTLTSLGSLNRIDSRRGDRMPENHHLPPLLDNFEGVSEVATGSFDNEAADVHPLVSLIKERAQAQCNGTDRLHTQISTLQDEIRNMAKELSKILPGQFQTTGLPEIWACLNRLGQNDNLDDIVKQLCAFLNEPKGSDSNSTFDADQILGNLKELKSGLDAGFPLVLERLNEISKDEKITHLHDKLDELLKSRGARVVPPSDQASTSAAPPDELVMEYRNLPRSSEKDEENPNRATSEHNCSPAQELPQVTLERILSLLENDQGRSKLQMDQQAESVRYLTELNTWLEKFVNNGALEIGSMLLVVQQLKDAIGIDSSKSKDNGALSSEADPLRNRGEAQVEGKNSTCPTLLANIQSLVDHREVQDRKIENLSTTLSELIHLISETNNGASAIAKESISELLKNHHEEQEGMLRSIAADLSVDIRGERLRFVDAMKEATAINVQIHVEEFKKELSREVLSLTHEVGRLQRERQTLEQQIGDLFTFITKQRAELAGSQRSGRMRSIRRPLPSPAPNGRPEITPAPPTTS